MLRRSVLWLIFLVVVPMTSLGCETVGNKQGSQLIKQLLLKPTVDVALTTEKHLSATYIQSLQQDLNEQAQFSVELQYIRPMSLGAHVLKLVPALSQEQAEQVSSILSGLESVEYAEPDSLRRTR